MSDLLHFSVGGDAPSDESDVRDLLRAHISYEKFHDLRVNLAHALVPVGWLLWLLTLFADQASRRLVSIALGVWVLIFSLFVGVWLQEHWWYAARCDRLSRVSKHEDTPP